MRLYRLESQEQVALMTWANLSRMKFPELDLLHAIPNGGHRNLLVAKKMKQEGVKAGVPDLCLPVARGCFHGLYLELKAVNMKPVKSGKGGVSDVQEWWHDNLRHQGYAVEVCYGEEEARNAIVKYLNRTTR